MYVAWMVRPASQTSKQPLGPDHGPPPPAAAACCRASEQDMPSWGWSYDWVGLGSVATAVVMIVVLALYCIAPPQQSESEMLRQLMEHGGSPLQEQALAQARSPIPPWKMELYRCGSPICPFAVRPLTVACADPLRRSAPGEEARGDATLRAASRSKKSGKEEDSRRFGPATATQTLSWEPSRGAGQMLSPRAVDAAG